jgi:hypothetical protein
MNVKDFISKLCDYAVVQHPTWAPVMRFAKPELLLLLDTFAPSQANLTPAQVVDEVFAYAESKTTNWFMLMVMRLANTEIDNLLAAFLASPAGQEFAKPS